MKCAAIFAVMVIASGTTQTVRGEDAYYFVPLDRVELALDELTERQTPVRWWAQERLRAMQPYATVDADGEVYLALNDWISRGSDVAQLAAQASIAIRLPKKRDVTGKLFAPTADFSRHEPFEFKIKSSAAAPEARERFLQTKAEHYERLLSRGLPGSAWFRHQAKEARLQLTGTAPAATTPPVGPMPWQPNTLDDTYLLLSGGRAVSENLQLDRDLQVAPSGEGDVPIDSIAGISVQEIDWKPLIKDLHPAADPLAALVPHDQHGVFFATFDDLVTLVDEAKADATPALRLMESRSENAVSQERYEQQLGVSLSAAARLIGPQLVKSACLTGSDPYFRTGTDVALLFETAQESTLTSLLAAEVELARQKHKKTKPMAGEVAGVRYLGAVSPDRRLSSYIATLEGTVVLTNSLAQLQRIVDVYQGRVQALASLDEYTFFRDRYPRSDDAETAWLFLSDATIRRWCSPRWRIGASRRIRAAAVMSDLQAGLLDDLVHGTVEAGPVHTDRFVADAGKWRVSRSGVQSDALGSLGFLTPISELPLERVSKAEADAYSRWRDAYQTNWRWAFDPIALRIEIEPGRLAADLSVMPLIFGTEYREWVELTGNARIGPSAGDPHDALAHWISAIDRESEPIRSLGGLASSFAPGLRAEPFGWLGSSIAWFADDDPIWKEIASLDADEAREEFISKNFQRLPVAAYCEVSDALKLTVFMAAVRAFVEQTAPQMTTWETLTHHDEPYVKVSPTARARGAVGEDFAQVSLYYSFSSEGLLLTLHEGVMKRYIDRQLARRKADSAGEKTESNRPWLGASMALAVDRSLVGLVAKLGQPGYTSAMQLRSWGNLPILNEWKRRYPDRDPVALHEEFWHTRLECPGGGKYIWNDKWQTMESTSLGHLGDPKSEISLPPLVENLTTADFGVSFADRGLRAKAVVIRSAD